jgi:hypothetical protein
LIRSIEKESRLRERDRRRRKRDQPEHSDVARRVLDLHPLHDDVRVEVRTVALVAHPRLIESVRADAEVQRLALHAARGEDLLELRRDRVGELHVVAVNE